MGAAKKKKTEVKTLRVDSNLLYKLQMKYQRSQVTAYEDLSGAISTQLDKIVEQGSKPDEYQLETMTSMLDFVIENIEREREEQAAKERSADEWRKMEYEFATVREGKYSMLTIEALPMFDETKHRECAHRFCITGFIPPRKNAMYCSEQCRKKEHASVKEFERTSKVYANGTYLPITAYMSNRSSYLEELYMEHELLFDSETLQLIANANSDEDEYDPTSKAANRERRMRESTIDYQVRLGKENPCPVTTYKLSEMSVEEIGEKFLETRIKELNPSDFSR